jgi:RNA polymerase subunit RPABC4/transcription elongation factor Spt4
LKFETAGLHECPKCGTDLSPEFNACPSCGEIIKTQCSGCSMFIGKSWRYCPYCGTANNDYVSYRKQDRKKLDFNRDFLSVPFSHGYQYMREAVSGFNRRVAKKRSDRKALVADAKRKKLDNKNAKTASKKKKVTNGKGKGEKNSKKKSSDSKRVKKKGKKK